MEYFDPQTQERYIPYVIETSVGLDRTILMLIADAYREEEVEGEKRVVLGLSPRLAPLTCAVFPLVKKGGMPEVARRIEHDLRRRFNVFYDEKGAVGRRYRRMDEAGTPFCVTIDGQTLDDETVTVRHRDSMRQDRVPANQLTSYLFDQLDGWSPSSE
jgi:glycyl-tRNA synthetase